MWSLPCEPVAYTIDRLTELHLQIKIQEPQTLTPLVILGPLSQTTVVALPEMPPVLTIGVCTEFYTGCYSLHAGGEPVEEEEERTNYKS